MVEMVPVRKPRPRGEYGTSPMPSSRSVGRISSSRCRVHREYSDWSAVIGWVAWARRIVESEASERPIRRTFPAVHELGHGTDRLLDRDRLVDPVLVVEVDVVDAEPGQAGVAGRLDVAGAAVDPAGFRVLGVAHVAELRGDDHLVSSTLDRSADQPLVGEGAVHVGGVEQRDAEVEGALDRRGRLGLVGACRRTPTSPCSRGLVPRRRGRCLGPRCRGCGDAVCWCQVRSWPKSFNSPARDVIRYGKAAPATTAGQELRSRFAISDWASYGALTFASLSK